MFPPKNGKQILFKSVYVYVKKAAVFHDIEKNVG